ncbi:SDR family oxidoreductase [Idiomarina seosinensis]|uniref:Short chain dehydrogenase n=1 Tax=Idiomarina seosinensis TaxID=281739 RepID=A0A432ZJ87_9GAMM|nr:SDR family oxidoreductase [Idiomarina seosinensis]RUO77900.1 short chain dehydrogenase [Idiomarina seosinensis]
MTAIKDKTIWLTGASSGIGLALAQQLAERGARLILTSRRPVQLEELRQSLANSESHQVLALDLSNPEQAKTDAQTALSGQTIDVLINNAGISQRSEALETDLAVYRRLMEIDYFGVIALNQVALPQMVKRQQGHIVTVASVAGKVGSKLRSGYSGAKFAVVGYMDCLRAEMAEHNVQVTSILPGFVNTQIAINALQADGNQQGHNDPEIESGISANTCAEGIINAIERNKAEAIIGKGLSALAPTLQRFFPTLVRRITAKRKA